jgi:hypothetical protein
VSPTRVAIVVLALSTALIHVYLALPLTIVPFYLNGLGYVALVTAFCMPRFRRWREQLRWTLIAFTTLTILLWLVLGRPYTTIGYVDKGIELALIGLLLLDRQKVRP